MGGQLYENGVFKPLYSDVDPKRPDQKYVNDWNASKSNDLIWYATRTEVTYYDNDLADQLLENYESWENGEKPEEPDTKTITYKYEDFNTSVDANGKTVYTLKDDVVRISDAAQPGDPKYKKLSDKDGNLITDADRTIIGNGQPKHTGGFSNNFVYKNWDLNIFLQWSYGNDILNANRMVFENPQAKKNTNMFASYTNRWSAENPTSNMPRARAIGAEYYSSLYVEDGSFLKLKTISLGYNFTPNTLRSLGISAARLFISAENIATITGYSGSDPEVSTRNSVLTPGFDWSAYPRSFNASLGINITF